MTEAVRGGSVHALVLRNGGDLRDDHLAAFWDDFLTTAAASSTRTLSGLRPTLAGACARPTTKKGALPIRADRHDRHAVLLSAKPRAPVSRQGHLAGGSGLATATLNVKTHYHLRLLAYHIVASGRAAYDAVIAAPETAAPFCRLDDDGVGALSSRDFSATSGSSFQSQKLRALECFSEHEGRAPPTPAELRAASSTRRSVPSAAASGDAIEVMEFLKSQFATEEDILDIPENWPRFRIDAHGVITQIE